MATWQMVNVVTLAPEGPKVTQEGDVSEVWTITLPNTTAAADTIVGPSLPANCTLLEIVVDTQSIAATSSISVGISGTAAKFISASNVGSAGGITRMSVAGSLGYTPTVATPIITTINTATTPAQGVFTMGITYTASP
jgi:hypothetical protein